METVQLLGHTIELAVISRRHVKASIISYGVDQSLLSDALSQRAGTRYNMRGIDSEGNVANNVETEQLVCVGDNIYSFVQIRGTCV